jgi:hypothetical protein
VEGKGEGMEMIVCVLAVLIVGGVVAKIMSEMDA